MTVAVIGAGPAGLTAAAMLAGVGTPVVLLDEQSELGGHLTYDQYEVTDGGGSEATRDRLVEAVNRVGVDVRLDSIVWGAFQASEGIELAVSRRGESESIRCEAAVFATGTTDRAIACPGATLPGVLTGRAVRILAARHGVVPGKRFAVIGGGGEADRLATDIARWGAEVATMVDSDELLRIEGRVRVDAIETAEGRVEADVVVIAAGELPDTQLPGMLGPSRVDKLGPGSLGIQPSGPVRTTAIIGGAALGYATIAEVMASAIDAMAVFDGSAAIPDLTAVSPADPTHVAATEDESTYLCRCECVTTETVRQAIAEGNLTINDVKRRTRAGMGICQGIFCVDLVARMLIEHGIDPASIEPMTARPPGRLIPLGAIESGSDL